MAGKGRRRGGKLRSIRKRRRRRRSSRELILPAELVDEIVVRLPIKSVIRFESVSKAWLSNFRSTLFKKFYEQRNNTYNPEAVHTMKLEDLYKMVPTLKRNNEALKPFQMRREVYTMGNGVYCLTSVLAITWGAKVDPLGCQIVLFNPAISQFNLLPPFPLEVMEITSGGHLACGFGTLPGCLGYRVVVIINCGRSWESFLVLVYSSSTDEWEKLVDYIPGKKIVGPSSATRAFERGEIGLIRTPHEVCSQTLFKGCWHWVAEQYGKPCLSGYCMVLSFDFAHQSFDILSGPPVGVTDKHTLVDTNVVVLHDHLSAISQRRYRNNNVPLLSVWMMMDYGVKESWTRIFNVDSTSILAHKLYRIDYSVDGKDEGGSDSVSIKKLFYIGVETPNEDIISFDHQGVHQVTPICHNSKEDIFLNTGGISSYKETLERPY